MKKILSVIGGFFAILLSLIVIILYAMYYFIVHEGILKNVFPKKYQQIETRERANFHQM